MKIQIFTNFIDVHANVQNVRKVIANPGELLK